VYPEPPVAQDGASVAVGYLEHDAGPGPARGRGRGRGRVWFTEANRQCVSRSGGGREATGDPVHIGRFDAYPLRQLGHDLRQYCGSVENHTVQPHLPIDGGVGMDGILDSGTFAVDVRVGQSDIERRARAQGIFRSCRDRLGGIERDR
jgi:hypothetical protein